MMREKHVKKHVNPGHVILRRIADLKPYFKNPKFHSPGQIDLVARSIREFGFITPIIIDVDNTVVAGHARLLAAKKLGLASVPCLLASHLTPIQIKAFRIADNKLTELSEWDDRFLQLEIQDLKLENFNLDLLGFSPQDLNLLLPVEESDLDDEVPLVDNRTIITQPDDRILLGPHRLLCGDARRCSDVNRLMAGEKAHMVFTDPPYGVNYKGGTREALTIQNDQDAEVFARSFDNFTVHPGAAFYVCCPSGPGYSAFENIFRSRCRMSSTLIWVKNALVMGHGDYHFQHETIIYGWEKTGKHKFYGDRKQTTVWCFNRPSKSEAHPTIKPVAMAKRAIQNSSLSGQLVQDLFGGSGTTLVACIRLDRQCRIMEIDPRYCDVIVKRYIAIAGTDNIKILRNKKTLPWPR